MRARRASLTNAQLAKGKVDLVMDDDEILQRLDVCICQQLDCFAGPVHVRQRLRHDHRPSCNPPAAGQRLFFVLIDFDAELCRERIGDHPAGIVAASRIFASGIAQPNDQFHDPSVADRLPVAGNWQLATGYRQLASGLVKKMH